MIKTIHTDDTICLFFLAYTLCMNPASEYSMQT